MAIVSCPSCGRDKASDAATSCPDCGFNIKEYYEKNPRKIVCPECGKEDNETNAKFCADCGFQFKKELPQANLNIPNTPYIQNNSYNLNYPNNINNQLYPNYYYNPNNSYYIGQPMYQPNIISDKWLWSLAIIPFLSYIFMVFIILSNPFLLLTFPRELLFVLVVILDLIFVLLDISELKRCGHKPEAGLALGFLFVPIYIFYRASKTTKNYAPGVICCILFVLSLIL